jgi:hypothetical protein
VKLESKIFSYLMKYGNTREGDLVSFIAEKFAVSLDDAKKAVDYMTARGKIHRIIHDELEPPELYLSLTTPLRQEVTEGLIAVSASFLVEQNPIFFLQKAASAVEQKEISRMTHL